MGCFYTPPKKDEGFCYYSYMSQWHLHLIAVRGPVEGRSFPVGTPNIVIGRDPSSTIHVVDLLVSRSHCSLRVDENGHLNVDDLGSSNGTFVNGKRIQTTVLNSGDRLEVGQSEFVLHTADEAADILRSPKLRCEDADTAFIQVASLPVTSDFRSASMSDNMLRALLAIGVSLSTWKTLAELEDLILREMMEGTPADHAILAYVDPESNEILETRVRTRPGHSSNSVISRTVLTEAFHSRSAILHRRDPSAPGSSESLVRSGALAILAAPLIVQGAVQAALYLDSAIGTAFQDVHLTLLSALAGITATPLETARHLEQLEREKRALERGAGHEFQMIGESEGMQNVYRVIRRVAPADTTVLILGESGTGKEMVARAIHNGSPRRERPLVAVNCACLNENLVESELFGHERGAFTGAVAPKAGKLEIAAGGTLFLDEVGELPLSVQAKLLRVLQEREFERVGGTRVRRADVRIIAATNQDLAQRVTDSRFRSDLFYRLNVVSVRLPALRERGGDVLLLASYFLNRMGARADRRISSISRPVRHALLNWYWPGNVRELQNVIERAIILGNEEELSLDDLPEDMPGDSTEEAPPHGYHGLVRDAKKQILRLAMRDANGKVTEAAKALSVNPKYLHRLLRNFGLKSDGSSSA
jgi:Nif-specific regulatory protein